MRVEILNLEKDKKKTLTWFCHDTNDRLPFKGHI